MITLVCSANSFTVYCTLLFSSLFSLPTATNEPDVSPISSLRVEEKGGQAFAKATLQREIKITYYKIKYVWWK